MADVNLQQVKTYGISSDKAIYHTCFFNNTATAIKVTLK
jgi:hypothetical protein